MGSKEDGRKVYCIQYSGGIEDGLKEGPNILREWLIWFVFFLIEVALFCLPI